MGLVLHQTGDMTAWTQQEPGVLLAPKPGPGVETPSLGWTRQALVTIQTRTGCLDFEKFRSFGLQDSRIYEEHIVTALLSPAVRLSPATGPGPCCCSGLSCRRPAERGESSEQGCRGEGGVSSLLAA